MSAANAKTYEQAARCGLFSFPKPARCGLFYWRDAERSTGEMPDKIFRLVESTDGGEPTYVEVNLAELELTDDHPRIKQLVADAKRLKAEAIDNRNRYKKLRDAISEEDSDEEGETPEPTQQATKSRGKSETVTTPEPLDEDALFEKFKQRLADEENSAKTLQQKRTEAVAAVVAKHKLPAVYVDVLAAYADQPDVLEQKAAAVVKAGFRFDDVPAGSEPIDISKFNGDNVLKNMGLD